MSRTDDLTGTSNRSFQLGVKNADSDISLRFKGKANGDLRWNPQSDRTIRFPDNSGTVQLIEDGYGVGASIYRSTALSVPAGGAAVSFNNSLWNTNGIYLPVQPTRLTCTVAGKYLVGGTVVFSGVALVSVREIRLRLNGTKTIAIDNRQTIANTVCPLSVARLWSMNVGDYVELMASNGTLLAIDLAVSDYQPDLWIQKIG